MRQLPPTVQYTIPVLAHAPLTTAMYRSNDPRFRRRLNEIGHSLETANEAAQSGLFVFGQNYVRPCFDGVTSCFRNCVDASCPTLNLNATQRDRLRRQRGQSRGRAELNFDFYDDWDEDENDALMGWGGGEEFDRLLAGSGGYGTIAQQPGRQRGMSYPKARRKSAGVQLNDNGEDPTVIPASSGFFGKLFGGKAKGLRYKPSAAGLQEHPGKRRLEGGLTEGEALVGSGRRHGRTRSGTATSGETTDSLSSRGDIFPSDEELDDAVPLDDEFAMVLERRTTQSIGASGPETESSSNKTKSDRKKTPTPTDENAPNVEGQFTLHDLKQEERRIEEEEEADVERKRLEAQKIAAERGLALSQAEDLSSKEATPHVQSPELQPQRPDDEPSQLPTPLATDDEEESVLSTQQTRREGNDESKQ
ncbi:uncharacterized protein LTR77_002319 [Saxophila tyrrhenica]|uniref:Uncharacterized protein n=1 Tax=Saxophila tyrrhenica TaxID=1690608 RepID=A0AAV9PLP6_9PEZI|nr:hypothetical protein LTR77_002319 [Saxophila tyrrhenica]